MRSDEPRQRRGAAPPPAGNDAGAGQRSLWDRARARVARSAWAPLGGRAAAYVAGFFALALVGSGHALRVLPFFGGSADAEAALLYGASVAGLPGGASAADAGAGADPAASAGAAADPDAGAGADAGADPDAGAGATGSGLTADGKVVLNLATAEELQRLPGVGPAKAAAILALRAKLKRFRKVEDLRRVKGIGRRSLERIRPLVVLDPP